MTIYISGFLKKYGERIQEVYDCEGYTQELIKPRLKLWYELDNKKWYKIITEKSIFMFIKGEIIKVYSTDEWEVCEEIPAF